MTSVFEPLTLRGVTFRNRLWVPPMCTYSCLDRDGVVGDFHLVHLGSRVNGGYGLVIAEATSVVPEGRISPQDAGLWNDEQGLAWKRVVDYAHSHGGALAVQLAHAGRKASTYAMRPGAVSGTVPIADGGWQTVAPSAVAFPGYAVPRALTTDEIAGVVRAFAEAAGRAASAGFDVAELHAAHGYLLHQFLSPLSNHRTDRYGGSLENRMRLLLEVTDAVRAVWPDDRPLFVRLSTTDWLDGGWDREQSCVLVRELKAHGVDLIDVSSGGLLPAPVEVRPGYQLPLARWIRAEGIPTAAVGLITTVEMAQQILDDGDADAVLFGREALRNPSMPLKAAFDAGLDAAAMGPVQYFRAWA